MMVVPVSYFCFGISMFPCLSLQLNCCIGERNHVWYIFGLALSEIALLLGANLTLTSICHPFMVVRPLGYPVLLPDDCSEVFEGFE